MPPFLLELQTFKYSFIMERKKINLYICLPSGADMERAREIIGKYSVDKEKCISDEDGAVWCVVTDISEVGITLDEIDRDVRRIDGGENMNYVFANRGWLYTDVEDEETLVVLSNRYYEDNGVNCGIRKRSVMEVSREYPWDFKIPDEGDVFVIRVKSMDGSGKICETVSRVKMREDMLLRYDSDAAYIYWISNKVSMRRFADIVTLSSYIRGYACENGEECKIDFWHMDCAEHKLYTGCGDARDNDRVILRYAQLGMHYTVVPVRMADIAKKALGL